jgi:hypothetical protein
MSERILEAFSNSSIEVPTRQQELLLTMYRHSCVRVQERFFANGFGHTYAATAGQAALYAAQKSGSTNKSPVHELFDEHSVLTLHLQSYVLVCAFSAGSDILFRRMQCSWTSGVLLTRSGKTCI